MLSKQEIAGLRELLDRGSNLTRESDAEQHEADCAQFIMSHGRALLDIAEAVANAPIATLSRADIGALNLPDSWSGKRVAVLPLAGEA